MSTASERPRILIVEDEPLVAADLQGSLEGLGYQVVGIAETAAQARVAAVENSPELIVMDVSLQGEPDGIVLAQEIHGKAGTPVVFLTGNSHEEVLAQASATGASGLLLKPFRIRELNAAILVALQQHRLARELFSERTWLRMLLDNLSEGVLATDPNGRVRHMNPAAEALTGWNLWEASGKPIEEISRLRTMADEPVEPCHVRRALSTNSLIGKTRLLLHSRDGQVIPIEETVSPIQAGGQVVGAISVMVDISERVRKEHEAALERDRLAEQAHATSEALGESRAELRALSAHLLTVQEDERRRMARELHDDVVQRMAVAQIDLQSVLPMLRPQDADVVGLVELTRQRMADVSTTLRELSHRLHPSVVEELGIDAALRSLVADYQNHGLDASFIRTRERPKLKPEIATALYRIAQEGLRNAQKHAPGAPVRVVLERTPAEFQLRVEDAGPGFDLGSVRGNGGLGLLSMQERAHLAGGTMLLRTSPGAGTLILVRVPLKIAETEES